MNIRDILYVMLLNFVLNYDGSDAFKCFKEDILQNMTIGHRIHHQPFWTFDTEILTCCKHCQLYSLCKAVNFNRDGFQCHLMSETPTHANTISNYDYILIDMEDWRESFLDSCKNHNCPNNTVCRELQGSYNCEVIGCTGVPGVSNTNSSSFETKALWGFNEMVEYACERGYYPSSNPMCSENGSWSEFDCKKMSRCSQIKRCNEGMEEKEYWLYTDLYQTLIKVFCKRGIGAFITFQHENLASFSPYTRTNTSCQQVSLDRPEETEVGITKFSKIKLGIIQGFKVFLENVQFSKSYLNSQKYGTARDCYYKNGTCGVRGEFHIDTRGTGFRFPESLTWNTVGRSARIENITVLMDGHMITGFCGGDCGGCEIDESGNGTILEIDMNDMPPFESAELPICPFLDFS